MPYWFGVPMLCPFLRQASDYAAPARGDNLDPPVLAKDFLCFRPLLLSGSQTANPGLPITGLGALEKALLPSNSPSAWASLPITMGDISRDMAISLARSRW
jgi:hypothetical protein